MNERVAPVSNPPKVTRPPPRRISGELTIAPEVSAMKKTQEEAKEKLNRIVEHVKIKSDPPKDQEKT